MYSRFVSFRFATNWLCVAVGAAVLLAGCGPTAKNGGELDTPTTGTISIAVDEVAVPIVRSTIATFESTYTSAHLKAQTIPQEVGFQLLLRDSVRLVIGSRKLNAEEKAAFAKRTITPHEYDYAQDAVAVIVHPANGDTLMTLDRIKAVLEGKETHWPSQPNLKIVPVLESGSGANAAFLQSQLGLAANFSANVYATGSTDKVVEYVASNPRAIGFIGVGYISDSDAPSARGFLKTVRVVSVSKEATATPDNSFAPYQAYLQLKQYPLARMLYIVSGEARSGLGTGFAAWALSEKGQRIVLKAGLLPATMPVRVVEVNTSNSFPE
jgi:phosphate transport system substrate-binding protein